MQATPRLCLGLPVRLLVGGPRMPKTARPAAASLSPSRGSYRGRRDVGVHRPIAPGRSSLPVPRESFHPSVPTLRNLASHPLRRLRRCPSNVETTPVQLYATPFPSGDPAERGISSYLRARAPDDVIVAQDLPITNGARPPWASDLRCRLSVQQTHG